MTALLRQRRIEHERLPQHRISPARLQAQHRLRIHEALAPVVEQQRIGHIAQRIAHAGRHEHVLVAVGIEVGHRHAPGPVGFGAHRRRHLRERVARTLILEERIAEHTVGGPTEQLRLPLRRAPRIALGLVEGDREIRITRIDLRRRHVGVHVGEDQIHQPVAVVVEELHAHRTPRRLAKKRRRPVLEAAPLTVHIIAVFARHAQHVQFRESIRIEIAKGRITAPAPMNESCRLRSILEAGSTPIVEERAHLAALWILPALKGVRTTHILPGAPLLIPRVHPHIADEEIQLPIAVVIEEHRTRPVPRLTPRNARLGRDVAEPTPALITKERQPLAHGGHQQVRPTVVIQVRKRSPHAHLARHRHPGLSRDLFEAPPSDIAPQLIAPALVGKEEVRPAVSVHIRRRDGRPVIIMNRLIIPGPVIHRHLPERNTALRYPVLELKPVEHLPSRRSAPLAFSVRLQRRPHGILQCHIWNLNCGIGGSCSSHQRQETDTWKPMGEGHGGRVVWVASYTTHNPFCKSSLPTTP